MKILITGGTGFLGGATALRLQSDGYEVSVLGRNRKRGAEMEAKGIRFFPVDLTDAKGVLHAFQGQERIIHCGALASPWGSYEAFHSANVLGTENVLVACKSVGVERLVNISTPSLYFNYRHRENISEDDPLPEKPATHYAATKHIADQLVETAYKEGLPYVSLRPRAIFGPGDTTVLGRIIKMAERGIVPLVGGGKSLVDMTYIDNAVDAVILALTTPPSNFGRTYNITNGEPMTAKTMFEFLFKKLGKRVRYIPVPFFLLDGFAHASESLYEAFGTKKEPPLTRYAVGLMATSQTLDISRARRELGYIPKVSIDEGFQRYATWWQSQMTPSPTLIPA